MGERRPCTDLAVLLKFGMFCGARPWQEIGFTTGARCASLQFHEKLEVTTVPHVHDLHVGWQLPTTGRGTRWQALASLRGTQCANTSVCGAIGHTRRTHLRKARWRWQRLRRECVTSRVWPCWIRCFVVHAFCTFVWCPRMVRQPCHGLPPHCVRGAQLRMVRLMPPVATNVESPMGWRPRTGTLGESFVASPVLLAVSVECWIFSERECKTAERTTSVLPETRPSVSNHCVLALMLMRRPQQWQRDVYCALQTLHSNSLVQSFRTSAVFKYLSLRPGAISFSVPFLPAFDLVFVSKVYISDCCTLQNCASTVHASENDRFEGNRSWRHCADEERSNVLWTRTFDFLNDVAQPSHRLCAHGPILRLQRCHFLEPTVIW